LLGVCGWLADAGGGQQDRQQGDDGVLGQGAGQRAGPGGPSDRQEGHDGGGQGDGDQAGLGQAGGGVVVAEHEAGHGQEAGQG